MPTLPSALIRPHVSPETVAEPESADVEQGESSESRGAQESRPSGKTRRRAKVASAEKTSKRGLYLTDSVWERLQLESIRRKKTNVSAVAGEILERNLPRLRIEREA